MIQYNQIYRSSPLLLQNLLISAYGYQWKRRRMGGVFPELYGLARDREAFTSSQWTDFQNAQLQKLLVHAFEQVPFYRTGFREAGFDGSTIRKLDTATLHRLPVLTKDALRKYGKTLLLADNKEKKGKFFASSGSTGTPVSIVYSPAMHQRWFAIFEARVRNWAGVNSHQPRGMIGGRRVIDSWKPEPPFYRYNFFEKQTYFSAYHISRSTAPDYLKGMLKHQVQYMTGYAMSNFFLARFFQETGLEAPEMKAIITSSEKLTPEMRNIFQSVYHCKTYDGWSGVEACGLITECEYGSLHISPDAGLIEVLDEAMHPVGPGVEGTVYCTGFLNTDQPLIRYRIGDRIILSDTKCSCGREMPVVQEIIGRTEDTVIGKDGREMVRFHNIFTGLKTVKYAQIVQHSYDEILVRIVPDKKLAKEETLLIRQRLESQLGNIRIFLEETETIPLNKNGKFQAVISTVNRNS